MACLFPVVGCAVVSMPGPGMWVVLLFSVVCARDVGWWFLFVWCFRAVAFIA